MTKTSLTCFVHARKKKTSQGSSEKSESGYR